MTQHETRPVSHGARYPGPPWRITGPSAVVMGLLDADVARKHVPDDLGIVRVRPGRTLAALVIADYRTGSTLRYSELSFMPALVRSGRRVGAWISSIWVDDETSLRGGREMWGVPKEMAEFAWDVDVGQTRVSVHTDGVELASFSWPRPRVSLPMPGLLSSIGSVDGDRRAFSGGGLSRMGMAPVQATVAADAPFAEQWEAVNPFLALAGVISLRFGHIRLLAPPAA